MTKPNRSVLRSKNMLRKAYIVGGIAGLAAAAFPVDDAGMSGENITIYREHHHL